MIRRRRHDAACDAHPTPEVLGAPDLGRSKIGWPGYPYYVEISAYNPIYINVRGKDGYRQLDSGQPGYIDTTEDPERLQSLLRRYLRIAWRLNHNPEYAKDTRTIVKEALEQIVGTT